ncbi:MAG: head-tail adaptor protein [Pseudomonadota bacterium]
MTLKPLLINAGQLRTPLRHQRPATTRDVHGAPQISWTDRGLAWGMFERAVASTKDRAQSDEAEMTAQIIVRLRSANPIQPGDRLVGRSVWTVNAVIDPDGTERFTRAYCTASQSETAS